MSAYYNELDPYAAQWLRNLIARGLIAPGKVDERSILEVAPDDLRGFTQCHFFAGIGIWSHALRSAGWSDNRPVWTGSCPCQPFSAAGKGGEFDDERHLFPAWANLIRECKPCVVLGEQVASKDGLAWLDLVHADLEAAGYAVGAVDTCAAGFGAPHIRQRLYFVAHTANADRRTGERGTQEGVGEDGERWRRLASSGAAGELAHADGGHTGTEGLQRGREHGLQPGRRGVVLVGNPASGGFGIDRSAPGQGGHVAQPEPVDQLGNPIEPGLERHAGHGDHGHGPGRLDAIEARPVTTAGATNGFWSDADWLPCRDGKARPVEPGTFPLAHGAPARVGRLRAYGNGLNAAQAQGFIEAVIEEYLAPG